MRNSGELQIPPSPWHDCLQVGFQVMNGTQFDITIREAHPSESAIILHHRRSMFRDMGEGTVEELNRMVASAEPWLARALANSSYRHWLALDRSGRVAGGGGVLLCP